MLVADVWTAVAGLAALVAAAAAVVTIIYAKKTVEEATAGRKETRDAHLEDVAASNQARADAAAQHAAELADRKAAFDAEIVLRRLEQLDRITDILIDLRDTIAQEDRHRIPSALHRLRVSYLFFTSLGGPEIPDVGTLGEASFGWGDKPSDFTGPVTAALAKVEWAARHDPLLKLQTDA